MQGGHGAGQGRQKIAETRGLRVCSTAAVLVGRNQREQHRFGHPAPPGAHTSWTSVAAFYCTSPFGRLHPGCALGPPLPATLVSRAAAVLNTCLPLFFLFIAGAAVAGVRVAPLGGGGCSPRPGGRRWSRLKWRRNEQAAAIIP